MAEERPDTLWTPAQRGVLIAFVLVFCAVLLGKVYLNRQYMTIGIAGVVLFLLSWPLQKWMHGVK